MISKKKQIIILIVLIILIFTAIIGWAVVNAIKTYNLEKENNQQGNGAQQEEVFIITGKIVDINFYGKFLVVVPDNEIDGKNVIISDSTLLQRLYYIEEDLSGAEEEKNLPKKRKIATITFSDFNVEDMVYIQSKENVLGKNEINQVEFITILP